MPIPMQLARLQTLNLDAVAPFGVYHGGGSELSLPSQPQRRLRQL